MESMRKINRYVCEKCGTVHGTINLNTGVTPFMIGCRSEDCDGMAQSAMYRLPAGETGVGWAWYRPIPAEFKRLPAAQQEHVLMGGLLLGDLEDVVNLKELDEDYEALTGDVDDFLAYIVNAYKPDHDLFDEIVQRLKGSEA